MQSKSWMVRSWMAPAFAVAVTLALNVMVRAADDKGSAAKSGGGTVTGTVVDKDGKAVANARVRVTPQHAKSGDATTKPSASAGGGSNANASSDTGSGSATTKPSASGGSSSGRQQPVAEGTTDADGKFSLANVPAGDYNVSASVKGQGAGREKVTVKEGETADVKLKLQDTKAKK